MSHACFIKFVIMHLPSVGKEVDVRDRLVSDLAFRLLIVHGKEEADQSRTDFSMLEKTLIQ